MEEQATVRLRVFVKPGCANCDRARRLAREVELDFPRLAVQVIDVREATDEVFAVPTFILNGDVLSLGNPQREELRGQIAALLAERGLVD